jgi:hypothetical protein
MKEFDLEQFEAELQRLKPVKPPEQTLQRIREELTAWPDEGLKPGRPARRTFVWGLFLRWLAPAGAVAAIAAGVLFSRHVSRNTETRTLPTASAEPAVLKADKVEIDRQLVADFDAITDLPGAEPMRFRCEQWVDKVRLRDTAAGLVIERTTPRVKIVPVRFDTY